jgi:GTPase SAR1 family protein
MSLPSRTQEWLNARLCELQRTLEDMGPDFSGFAAATYQLCRRLEEGRFRLAVLGQFKRGKSTLLNALIREPLLPTGVLPLTAIPTTIRYGRDRHVRITFRNGHTEDFDGSLETLQQVLKRYVTEEENPANELGVAQVEVDHPATILASGVEIIDTPGIGSTLLHNTRTARETLPICDGAVFVLSPDPPITEAEVQFLKAVHEAATRVIFVLTKTDTLMSSDREALLPFLRKILHDQAGFAGQQPIFLVSARQALEAHATGAGPLLSASGITALETYLGDFFLTDKQMALQEAIRAKAGRVIGEVLFAVDFQRKVIDLPREDLERRSQRFNAYLDKMERERVYFRDRLAGDRHRLLAGLDQLTEALVEPVTKALSARAERVRGEAGPITAGPELRRRIHTALSEEVDAVFGHAAKNLWATVSHQFQTLQDTHCREMETLIDRVRRTAADLFEVPCLEGVALDRLEAIRESRVISQRVVTSFIEEAESWLTRWLPRRWRARQFERQVNATITYLVARNVEELRWTTRQNLDETLRLFQGRMDTQLEAVIESIRAALRAALDRQARREAIGKPELQRLEESRQRLEQLLADLALPGKPKSHGSPV